MEVLAVLDPHQISSVMTATPAIAGGYPVPGLQSPTVTTAMNKKCFVDDNTWRLILEHGEFDDIVVGSSFCGLAYIDQAFKQNPFRKILLLERGGFWLPDHFQNLPLPFEFVHYNVSQTFPWELTHETAQNKRYLNGSSPFFGGRSSFWSNWSPRAIGPDFDLMDGFPSFMKEIAKEPSFYQGVDKLLHLKPANEIKDAVFEVLQERFDHYLSVINRPNNPIPAAAAAEPARLACGVHVGQSTSAFRQFSAVGPLLAINEKQDNLARKKIPDGKPLMIATDVVVERFEVDPGSNTARVLHTSRGPISLRSGKTNVILATGAVPATTILLNSIGDKLEGRAGKRLTAHFRSSIKARFRPDSTWIGAPKLPSHPTIAACHVRGRASNSLQWHAQVNGIHVSHEFYEDIHLDEEKAQAHAALFANVCPDYSTALSSAQWLHSDSYVVVSCAVLGELPPDTDSWVRHNKSATDVTTNIRLNVDVPAKALTVWDEMEKATFEVIKVVAAHKAPDLEYWNNVKELWEKAEPSVNHVKRIRPLFHEASTLYMAENLTEDTTASVNKSYRPHGLENGNIYVTGAALFPTAGSWNPTATICGFAQDLAKYLITS